MNTSKLALITMCLALVITSFMASACSKTTADDESWQVSLEEATNVLNQAVAYARAGNLEKLGELAQDHSMTRLSWEYAGGQSAVPAEPPTIVDSYLLPTVSLNNGSQATGGRVLVLEGTDGWGRPYRTESLVFWTDGTNSTPGVINVVYWSGAGIGQYNEDGSGTTELRSSPTP